MVEIKWLSFACMWLLFIAGFILMTMAFKFPSEKVIVVEKEKFPSNRLTKKEEIYPLSDWSRLITYRRIGGMLEVRAADDRFKHEWIKVLRTIFPQLPFDFESISISEKGDSVKVRVNGWTRLYNEDN